MAKPRPTAAPPVRPTHSLVAASTKINLATKRIRSADSNQWQREIYRYISIIGEARYAVMFYSNALGRATLGVGEPGQFHRAQWQTKGSEVFTLDTVFPSVRAQRAFLKGAGLHLVAVGECYLIGRGTEEYDNESEDKQIWEVVSVLEVETTGDVWTVKYANGQKITLTEDDVVIRIWLPRPDNRMEADSPLRAMLPILAEIEWETRHIFTQIRSRLINSGVWFLPQGLTFPPPPSVDGEEQAYANEAESFMALVAESGMELMDNPDEPGFPITVMAPAEVYDKIDQGKLIKFWSEIDEKVMVLRNDAIRRFALGMDLPPERVLGMAGGGGDVGDRDGAANHWTSWQIEEDTIKMHIEPMLDVLVDALTDSILVPLNPGTTYVVVYETSALRLRPDRSKESIELFDRGLLKGSVTLHENGFDPEVDGMDEDERKLWLVAKIASGSASPEMVQAALFLMGIDLPVREPVDSNISIEQIAPEAPQPPSLEEHPSRPRTPNESSALVAASEGLVLRALEKAGNRALNDGRRGKDKHRDVQPHMAHTLIQYGNEDLFEGAFSFAPVVLEGLCEPEEMSMVLKHYCEALAVTQTAHTRENLVSFLTNRQVLAFPPTQTDKTLMAALVEALGKVGQPNISVTQAPINVHVPERQVELRVNPTPITVENHVQAAESPVTVYNDVNPTPINVHAAVQPAPVVNVSTNPTPVTIENHVEVEPTPITVESPTVTVESPTVTVEAPQITVTPTIETKMGRRKTSVQRDANGDITGAVETDG